MESNMNALIKSIMNNPKSSTSSTMERKTINYYREELKKRPTIALITEIVKKYGKEKYHTRICFNCKFNWNHRVEGFYLGKNDTLWLDIYWQGDSTDGSDSVKVSDLWNRKEVVIPAESFFDGYRTRTTHSDIRVDKSELDEAIAKLLEWLSPEAVKARKEYAVMREILARESKIVGNELYNKYASRWGENTRYYKGSDSAEAYARENYKALTKKSEEEFHKAIVDAFLKGYNA